MFGGRIGTFNIILEIGNLNEGKWPLETAEKRTGLEFRLRCGEVGRPAAALHFASGLHAALRYLLRESSWMVEKVQKAA